MFLVTLYVPFKHILTNYSKSSLNISHGANILLIFRPQTAEEKLTETEEMRIEHLLSPRLVSFSVLHTELMNQPMKVKQETTHCPSIKITE